MAAPLLEFPGQKDEEKKRSGSTPPPPDPITDPSLPDWARKGLTPRDPKKHSWLSNTWQGIESVPRGLQEQVEMYAHAARKDISKPHGLVGLALGNKRGEADVLTEKLLKESYETTRRATGTRGSKKFKEIWHDNPVAALGSVAIFLPPAARVAGIGKMASTIKAANRVPTKEGTRAMTTTEATRAAITESYYPGTLDNLGIKGSPFPPRFSGRKVSRTPTGRAAQRAFDWTSEKIDTGIGVGERRTGPDTPLSRTRREAAGKRRADDLDRARLVTDAMRHASTFADYLNDTTLTRVGTALGGRKETLASRDAAVGMALHASNAIDPVDAVRLGSEDTKAILASGKRDAHNGDIGDLEPHHRVGQTVYVTHGMDEDGNPIREEATVTADDNGRVTVATPQGEMTIPHNRAHLLGPNGEGEIPLHSDEVKMLRRRAALLDTAHEELLAEPRLQEKFRAAVQTMADLGLKSEKLGIEYATRGMDPTGSDAMAVVERFDSRRNQFLPRLGGEGVDPIDFHEGLWANLIDTMVKAGLPENQIHVMLVLFERQARVWAGEVKGRNPADYLSSKEGANLGGIDYSTPEDLEATLNAMFQTAGERNHLVTTTTTVLITGPPEVGNLVSTPKGMGFVREVGDKAVRVDMAEGAHLSQTFPIEDIRVSPHPWRGQPQVGDYVRTPDGLGRLEEVHEGPAPDFTRSYHVMLFEDQNGMFVDDAIATYKAGEVQRVDNLQEEGPVFHLLSQQTLADPKFPTKGKVEQYRAAFDNAGVKADEYYWMGLSAFPVLEGEVISARVAVETIEKAMKEDPEQLFRYRPLGEYNDRHISGEELLAIRRPELAAAEARLARYTEQPDGENFILDADWGGKSFPAKAIEDKVNSRALFLDLKETLFSSNAPESHLRDEWGPGRGHGDSPSTLVIRDPTDDQPYHELILQLPHDELQSPNPHWDRLHESPLVHIRFHEIIDNEGRRVILIDELQSDWSNVGRLAGFRHITTPRDAVMAAHMRDKERSIRDLMNKAEVEYGFGEADVNNWYDRVIREKTEEMNAEINARNADLEVRRDEALANGENVTGDEWRHESRVYDYGNGRERVEERLLADNANDQIFQGMMKAKRRFERLGQKRRELREAADAIETGGGGWGAANRGPVVMSDAAKYLAMKRMIRWAADHGQTRIIWTRGHEHGVRYSKFDELPIERKNQNPEDHGGTYYFKSGSTEIEMGRHYSSRDITPSKLYRMQQAWPVEVKWADLEEFGDGYVLLPNGHPGDTPEGIPGQQSLLPGEPEIPFNPAQHPRWAKIISETDDGVVVQAVDPEWDPASVDISFRSETGIHVPESRGFDYGTWDVQITNRMGDSVYNDSVYGQFASKSEVLEAVKKDWERTHRNWSPSGEAAEVTEANVAKMHQLIEILNESDSVTSEFDHMESSLEKELDYDAWDEYLREDNSDGLWGEFKDIRDHPPYGLERVKRLRDELATLERKRQEAIEYETPQFFDRLDAEIIQVKRSLKQATDGVENRKHSQNYDVMMPLVGKKMLHPYRKDADHHPVELMHEIYKGRYSAEGKGILSDVGDMHGWVMDLPERMLKDAREGTVPLFQRGNDVIKGASTWVGGPDGQRFIALTEHADFSTLMHEFIGHATEEMKRRYPELWEAVEADMGKPLEKWTAADHEKFAKQVERYFMEGKAPSPELHTVMKLVKEWMKGVYSSITQLGKPMPASTRILLDRHLGQGVTARPGARAYVPHISQFDTLIDNAPGGTRLGAAGNVLGKPRVDRRNFGARHNRGILWQSGELAMSARPIIDQYFRRTKFLETEAVRQEMYDEGHPMPKNGRPPKGAWLVRNPEKGVERLSARNKSRLSEEDFSRLIGEGDTPEEFATKMEEIRKEHYAEPGEHPEWADDLENTRWVEGGKITQRIQNVFPSAPRGRGAASVGSLNAMARLTGIYLRPLHYLVGNIPQNVIMVALTNPSALVNSVKYGAYSFLPRVVREVGMQPRDLFAHDRHLYNEIKTETGDIQAGAGLPDFYTMANNRFQKGERRLNKISQGSAEKLGELADQPYRVSVWMAHAKGYGYHTPDDWRRLLHSERGTPEARIRDDIAQSTREDMIDFNTLNPWEREHISRFFYLWAFTRGFAKWPLTFAREYPGRTGFAMMQADSEETDDNGLPLGWLPSSGVLKSNKGKGKVRDLGFLDPTGGLRQQIETGIQLAHGNISGIGSMTTPPLETALQAATGGPRAPKGGLGGLADQLARDTVPFYDITRKTATPGLGVTDRVLRFLDFTDRFGVKPEIGRGKNADKKRIEDEKIRSTLKAADRMDALPLVTLQQDAYWHHKYLEQQIRFGAQARRRGTALNDEEKLTILYATARDYFPQANLPRLTEALKESAAYQKALRAALSDSMFGARNQVVNAG